MSNWTRWVLRMCHCAAAAVSRVSLRASRCCFAFLLPSKAFRCKNDTRPTFLLRTRPNGAKSRLLLRMRAFRALSCASHCRWLFLLSPSRSSRSCCGRAGPGQDNARAIGCFVKINAFHAQQAETATKGKLIPDVVLCRASRNRLTSE